MYTGTVNQGKVYLYYVWPQCFGKTKLRSSWFCPRNLFLLWNWPKHRKSLYHSVLGFLRSYLGAVRALTVMYSNRSQQSTVNRSQHLLFYLLNVFNHSNRTLSASHLENNTAFTLWRSEGLHHTLSVCSSVGAWVFHKPVLMFLKMLAWSSSCGQLRQVCAS